MITLYKWDSQRIYCGSVDVDPNGEMPLNSTPLQPPEAEFAYWNGSGWDVISERPEEPEPVIGWSAEISARRWKAEVAGVDIGDFHVDTDDRSKLLINGAALEAMIDPAYTMNWKAEGGFVELDSTQVLAVARAVRAHVQACFDREAELLAAVDDGSITDEMLTEGWPDEAIPEEPES